MLESVKSDPNSSQNWYSLYKLYLKKGNKEKAKECITKAVKNVCVIWKPDMEFDTTSIETFINESYKGTNISYIIYKSRVEEMNKLLYSFWKRLMLPFKKRIRK